MAGFRHKNGKISLNIALTPEEIEKFKDIWIRTSILPIEYKNHLPSCSMKDLNNMLNKAVKVENYDVAIQLRDEINKRIKK